MELNRAPEADSKHTPVKRGQAPAKPAAWIRMAAATRAGSVPEAIGPSSLSASESRWYGEAEVTVTALV